jgi:hypothetical protein
MNKRKKVAWHKHLAKAKKADEKKKLAKAAPATGARAAASTKTPPRDSVTGHGTRRGRFPLP